MRYHRTCLILSWLTFVVMGVFATSVASVDAAERPNVVFVMTDDQGYGDLACHGNPEIKTPNMDKLYSESVRLTNYHVDPTCAPTRSALMSGRYSSRTGVWHTIMGRSLMHTDEVTIAEVFAEAGYRTGMFGKWHLGDNYPCRPQDQGFQEVWRNGGGGVTQTPDYWGNDYFDDTYYHNGVPEKCQGYCTDIWFDAAMTFIESNRDRPFFVYLPTNAPHGPYLVADKYSDPYKKMGIPSPRAEFYGMITNIDENLKRLRNKLRQLGLDQNTILVFATDNGTAAGMRGGGFNAGMRGTKGSEYDGGHRVPFFIRWPNGGLTGGRDVSQITAHIDVLPTLADLCEIKLPVTLDLDGTSLVPLLKGQTHWKDRTLFVHSQRIEFPEEWRRCSVMTNRWRLVDGKELYDMRSDASQQTDVASGHPEVFQRLRSAYEGWYDHISDRFDDYVRIVLGASAANPVNLTCHDWHTNNGPVPWNQAIIKTDPTANGFWAVDVVRAGHYQFTLRPRPTGVHYSLKSGTARLKIGDVNISRPVTPGADSVQFEANLKAGKAQLQTWLDEAGGRSRGAYFVEVRSLD